MGHFSGKNTPKHKYLLNTCIIVWGQSLIMKRYGNIDIKSLPDKERTKEKLQPNSIETYHKQFFSSFQFCGTTYLQHHFKYYAGSYNFYWKKRFAATLLHRPRYGILEKHIACDKKEEAKIWDLLDTDSSVFTPYSNYKHLMEIMVFRILKTWLLRKMNESATLLPQDIAAGEHKKGSFKGLNYVFIKRIKGEKMVKLSFEKTMVREGTNTYILKGKMNEYCVVSSIMFYIENHLPTDWEGPLCLQKAKVMDIK